MKSTLFPAAVLLFLAISSGCATKKETSSTPNALDVSGPVVTSTTPAPSYTPATAAPVLAAPDPAYSQTPAASTGTATGGGNYVVKKGDTLYRIAKEHYGDGKQWQKIASANPGVSPQSLKVGQTLVLP